MNRVNINFVFIFLLMLSLDAHAWGTLKSQFVNGFSRYCTYSYGGILTVGNTDLCPIKNYEQSKNNGYPTVDVKNRNVGFGSLKKQKVKGFNRYCFYSDDTVLTVGSTDLCPIISK